ncbi:MAG TPA: PH domain-containing protein [Candidatus Microsaccharimonas sp.]|nr:PH domain-containing protein [Candidatus Microsaccharimonas sp.]
MFKKHKVQESAKPTTEKPQKYFKDQFDDEAVLFVFRKHPIVMRKGLIFGMGSWIIGPVYCIIPILLHPNDPSVAPTMTFFFLSLVASVVVGSIIFAPSYMSWHFSVFVVTNQRFIQITQKGFFHRSVVDMSLGQIQMVNYEVSGLQETLLGFGTIMMQTFVGDLVIHEVHHPAKIQKKIIGILRDQGVSASVGPSTVNESPNELDEEEPQTA